MPVVAATKGSAGSEGENKTVKKLKMRFMAFLSHAEEF